MLTDESLEAAIITTGFMNHDLAELLDSGKYDLIEIDESRALCLKNSSMVEIEIPRGLFGKGAALPDRPVKTVATTAFLGARKDASDALVSHTLDALFLTEATSKLPGLIDRSEAMNWQRVGMHPAARAYFDPYGGLDTLASFMESLAAGKELLFAFGAGMYLLWDRNRRKKQQAHDGAISEMKERLDILLEKTARIDVRRWRLPSPLCSRVISTR